jgi:hypothetical protein
MKFFRIDLLTLLISLFILSSCKNQDGIGLDPSQTLSGTLLVDTNIVVNTLPEDTVVTNGLAKTPLGYFNDPVIGTTEANIAMAISLPSASAYTIPTGTITIDSALLVLRYADGFYGDSLNSKFKINVYQLKEKPLSTINYYNTRAWSYDNTALIGSKTFNSRTHTSIRISDIVTGAADTLKKVPAQVRVPLSGTFFQTNLFNASAATLASNTVFQDQVKGLYLTMDKGQIGPGGNFMMAIDSSNIAIYYRTDDGAGNIDTAVVTLPLGARAAQIKHVYTATVQAAINQTTSNSTFYLQGLAGLRAKVSFPGLTTLLNQAGNIVINRAELVVTPVNGSTIPFLPQNKLSLYQLDIAKQRIVLQDANPNDARYLGVSNFGGYLTTNYDYHFLVTAYIQDLMRGKTVDYGTYLGPVDIINTSSVDYQPTPQTGGRVVAVGSIGNKASVDYPYHIKLNIIYTKVNN